jgi:hypothetical protein
MFVLNGNRRPNHAFSIYINAKKNNSNNLPLYTSLVTDVVQHLNRNVTKRKDILPLFRADKNKIDVVIEQNMLYDEINNNKSYVVFNIVENKSKNHPLHGLVAYIYVLPKTILVRAPIQYKKNFQASIRPDVTVESFSADPLVKLFKFSKGRAKPIYIRSKTEAEFYASETGLSFTVVDALKVAKVSVDSAQEGYDLYINNKKIEVTLVKTDVYSIHVTTDSYKAKSKFKKTHKFVFHGKNIEVFSDRDIKTLPAGLYQTAGDTFGYIFIEQFESLVSGVFRQYHFLESNDKHVKAILEKFSVSKAVEVVD